MLLASDRQGQDAADTLKQHRVASDYVVKEIGKATEIN